MAPTTSRFSARNRLVACACAACLAIGGIAAPALASTASGSSFSSPSAGSSAASSSAGSRSSTAGGKEASTVERNKTLTFEDIPEDALMTIDELRDLLAQDEDPYLVVDIRSHRDYQKTLIEGTRNIPAGRQIEIRIDEFPKDELIVLIAYKNSDRLAETRQTLIDHGYDPELIKVVEGGVNAWKAADYPVLKNQFLGC